MTSITVSRVINAPIETVFARASDPHRWADQISAITDIEVLTEGPVGIGTRFKETRVMFGKKATEEMTFSEFSPPTGYTLLADSHGSAYVTKHSFEPDGDSTRMTMHFEATPHSLGAKLLSPMFSLMKNSLKKCIAGDLDDLAKACEADVAGDESASA